jgi:hypothetical protein
MADFSDDGQQVFIDNQWRQLSPDKKWWWDGESWQPLEDTPTPGAGQPKKSNLPLFAILGLIFCFPVGLVLVFLTSWRPRTKLIVAGLTSLLAVGLVAAVAATPPTKTTTTAAPTPTRSAVATPTPNHFPDLSGKRLPGAPTDWIPMASPLQNPVNVSTTITPPVQTNGTADGGAQQTVAFFDFGNEADATAFYDKPPLDARLISTGILAYKQLAGYTGIPAPSRGLDLRSCLWAGGPGQGGDNGRGTPSGGDLLPTGQCSAGTSSSIGVATILRRGQVVVIVESIDTSVIGGPASPAELSKITALASSALQLMQSVGLA